MKKNLFLLFLLTAINACLFAQTNQWTFYKGDASIPQQPLYGTQGVPAATNKPGVKSSGASWTDASGNLWMFGGFEAADLTNDLWRYNPTTNQWTWMKGDSTLNKSAVYGTQGVPAASNKPGARQNCVTWTDASGNFWLFGGFGYDAGTVQGSLNDLWRYNPATNEWTWMKGDNIIGGTDVYGTQGIADPANKPGSRLASTSWTDAAGNFWLFGGERSPFVFADQVYNDLWKYDVSTNQWTFIKGNTFFTNQGIYGTQAVSAAGNLPGGRIDCMGWADNAGNLWLFGGVGFSASPGDYSFLNDLWRYNISTNEWTWMNGDNTTNNFGIYTTQGVPSASNKPGSRQSGMSWKDASGTLWMMGGFGISSIPFDFGLMNDLWTYNPATNEWTWVKGGNTSNNPDRYGIQGVADPNNTPGGRFESPTWATSSSNTLWLFGGTSYNDLWKYDIASNNWTWLKGDTAFNNFGIYGTQGVASATNKPGPRNFAVSFKDNTGNLWLFGGIGSSARNSGGLNDLWKYNINNNQWSWMKGDSTFNDKGVYGLLGVPNAANKPGARYQGSGWADAAGNFWLFGGFGLYPGTVNPFNDLWKYDVASNNWTWIKGDSNTNFSNYFGVYGTKGVADPANKPGARFGAATWTDNAGNLWLFGGFGYGNSASDFNFLNDLWKYDISNNQWTWMSGDNTGGQTGVFGTKGIADPANKPGGRQTYAGTWKDAAGNLWLFGGWGFSATPDFSGNLNDLWKYDISTNQWTWMSGDNIVNATTVYGVQGTPSASNKPGARNNGHSWADPSGNLWFFGGTGVTSVPSESNVVNDLWKYNTTTNEWTWVGGDNIPNQPGIYGTAGIPSPGNKPGARANGVSWTDNTGNFWMFGGNGQMARGFAALNDLWKYTVVTPPPTECSGAGKISAEGYTNIPGNKVSNLTGHPSYPNSPSIFALLNKFEYGNNIGNNYGARVRGYICAPQTGYYYFAISSDDQSELWLSTNDNPANKQKIAWLNFPVLPGIYTLFPSQTSARIWLVKGTRYYIESLHKEGVGLDHLSVAWKLPNGTIEAPIPGNRLTPWQTTSTIVTGNGNQTLEKAMGEVITGELSGLSVSATPNPSPAHFTLVTRSSSDKPLLITVTDVLGRVVERKSNVPANATIQFGDKLRPGMYIVEVVQGDQRQKLKLIRQ